MNFEIIKEERGLDLTEEMDCIESCSKLLENAKLYCVSCGADLVKSLPYVGSYIRVDMYDHLDGWLVSERMDKQWLSVHCDKCNYDNSVWKLGVPRE
jgi:hypothetical protein